MPFVLTIPKLRAYALYAVQPSQKKYEAGHLSSIPPKLPHIKLG
jgi:hypothetical protein